MTAQEIRISAWRWLKHDTITTTDYKLKCDFNKYVDNPCSFVVARNIGSVLGVVIITGTASKSHSDPNIWCAKCKTQGLVDGSDTNEIVFNWRCVVPQRMLCYWLQKEPRWGRAANYRYCKKHRKTNTWCAKCNISRVWRKVVLQHFAWIVMKYSWRRWKMLLAGLSLKNL